MAAGIHLRTVRSSEKGQPFAILIAMSALAVFVGLIASTANLILIVLLVGLMVGIPLLAAPRITIWMILALGMTSGFLISTLGPASSKLAWCVALLGLLLVLPVIVKLLEGVKGVPAFIWLAIIFMLYTVIAALVQSAPLGDNKLA